MDRDLCHFHCKKWERKNVGVHLISVRTMTFQDQHHGQRSCHIHFKENQTAVVKLYNHQHWNITTSYFYCCIVINILLLTNGDSHPASTILLLELLELCAFFIEHLLCQLTCLTGFFFVLPVIWCSSINRGPEVVVPNASMHGRRGV